jgi:hypothetical protein
MVIFRLMRVSPMLFIRPIPVRNHISYNLLRKGFIQERKPKRNIINGFDKLGFLRLGEEKYTKHQPTTPHKSTCAVSLSQTHMYTLTYQNDLHQINFALIVPVHDHDDATSCMPHRVNASKVVQEHHDLAIGTSSAPPYYSSTRVHVASSPRNSFCPSRDVERHHCH